MKKKKTNPPVTTNQSQLLVKPFLLVYTIQYIGIRVNKYLVKYPLDSMSTEIYWTGVAAFLFEKKAFLIFNNISHFYKCVLHIYFVYLIL